MADGNVSGTKPTERRSSILDTEEKRRQSITELTANTEGEIRNPLVGLSKQELIADVEGFAREHQLEDITPILIKGALAAQAPALIDEIEELDENDRVTLREETT